LKTVFKNTTSYRKPNSKSKSLYSQALECFPGGNTRHTLIFSPYPVYASRGKGCRVVDVDGEERIDFINNYTSLILGHSHPAIVEAVKNQLEKGTCFGMPTESEIRLASLLIKRVPYIKKVRFCNSGSEAVMLAIKASRAYTGKYKIAKIEGAYHGLYDYAQVSEAPSHQTWGDKNCPSSVVEKSATPSVKNDVLVLPWNNKQACENLLEKNKNELAAVLIDTLPANFGFIPPQDGFLESIWEVAKTYGILFISDEVIGFRLNLKGACDEFGIKPDLVTLGKIIGGGFPIGALGGKDEVMEVFDHTKGIKVHHGGSFNANPVSMVAGYATLNELGPGEYERLNKMGDELRIKLNDFFLTRKISAQATGKGSLFCIHLTREKLLDYRSFVNSRVNRALLDKFFHELLGNGILLDSTRGIGCLSTPMGNEELEFFLKALEISFKRLNL